MLPDRICWNGFFFFHLLLVGSTEHTAAVLQPYHCVCELTNCPQQSNNQVNARLANHSLVTERCAVIFTKRRMPTKIDLCRDLQLKKQVSDFGDQLNGKQWPLKSRVQESLIFRRHSSILDLSIAPILPLTWRISNLSRSFLRNPLCKAFQIETFY